MKQSNGRTDLAVELREDFSEDDERIRGVTAFEAYRNGGKVHISTVQITDAAGAEAMGRPVGTYINVEAKELGNGEETLRHSVAETIAEQLTGLLSSINKEKKSNSKAMAIELDNGKIITGRQTKLLSPAASLILNSIKYLTDIPDEIDLLSPSILKPILKLKKEKDICITEESEEEFDMFDSKYFDEVMGFKVQVMDMW